MRKQLLPEIEALALSPHPSARSQSFSFLLPHPDPPPLTLQHYPKETSNIAPLPFLESKKVKWKKESSKGFLFGKDNGVSSGRRTSKWGGIKQGKTPEAKESEGRSVHVENP